MFGYRSKFKIILLFRLFLGEIILLVSEVYLMCIIDPLNFNRVLLVSQVLKLSVINLLLITINIIVYITNGIMM